jgi:ParB/RepB/Spo0J family partition protein
MRVSMDEPALIELANSLRDVGQLMPLLVTPRYQQCHECESLDDSPCRHSLAGELTRYEIIDGHRRYLASAIVNLTDLDCTVYDNCEDAKFAMMVHANLMREDVTPAEEGIQYLQLAEKHGWGIEQLCRTFKRTEAYINARVRLVQEDAELTQAVGERKIGLSVATVLLKVKDKEHRHYLIQMALTHGATVRTAEAWVSSWDAQLAASGGEAPPPVVVSQQPWQAPPVEPCVWCLDNDNAQHMRTVNVHPWHLKDLLRWLEAAGVHPAQPSTSGAASGEAPATERT